MKSFSAARAQLKEKAIRLKQELHALYLASRDPGTPWYAKFFVICIVAYALSPIDLIPDPIPVLGYLDDLLLLPLGIYLALKMIPEEVLTRCRQKAETCPAVLPRNWIAGAVIVVMWIGALVLLGFYLMKCVRG